MSNTIVVKTQTQRIVVNPVTQAVTIIHAGPPGPRGDSIIPIPGDPNDDGKVPIALAGAFGLGKVVRSDEIIWLVPITQLAWDALPTPRDPSIMYVIRD